MTTRHSHRSWWRIGIGSLRRSPAFPVTPAPQIVYKQAGTSAYRDIASKGVTDGVVRVDYTNGYDASGGRTTSLRTFNQTGTLSTRPGYDDVTGLGTPNIAGLLGK